MRVRFYIEKRRGDDGKLLTSKRPIFMTVAFHAKRVLISTGQNVDLRWWDPEKQRVRDVYPGAGLINIWLNELEFTASVVWKALVSLSENPGVSEFREEFEKLRPRFSGGFFDVMFMFLEEGNMRWSKGTYKKVRTFYNQLKEFEKETAFAIGFNTMDAEFLKTFERVQTEKGRSPVTILKMVNTLVWFLNWATDKGYNIYSEYRQFYKLLDVQNVHEERVPVYLDWGELMTMNSYSDLDPKKERVRDLFCLMCFTGLRFGELNRLQKDDVEDTLLIVQKKQGAGRKVPLNKYAGEILSRYTNRYYRNNTALPVVSAVTMNKYLKIVGREIGLNRVVSGKVGAENVNLPLFELLTAGVAVQTFIMNALRLDISPEIIASYTGVTKDLRIEILKHEMAKHEISKFNHI